MTISDEVLVGLLGMAVASVPWAFSVHAKVAVIAEAVQHIPEVIDGLRTKVECVEHRTTRNEADIEAIKAATTARH